IETVSYALIVLVGARLFWVKGRAFLRTLHALNEKSLPVEQDAAHAHHGHAACRHHNHAHHHHEPGEATGANTDRHHHEHGGHHAHSHDHEENVLPGGHAHGPEPEELAGPGGWRRGLLAIVAVGLRPCSGAIIVLVFALAQGLFWAGVASRFVMAIGTAITVA